jgi:hypothetical protein
MRCTRKRGSVVAAALGLVLAGTAFAADPTAGFPAGWTHLQINVVGPHGKTHTLIYDRGRVQSVTPSSVTLRENDGSIVTIQVAPNAVVMIDGQPGSFSQIAPRFWVRTLGVDGLPATRVAGTTPPPPPPRRARPALGRLASTTTTSTPVSATPNRYSGLLRKTSYTRSHGRQRSSRRG